MSHFPDAPYQSNPDPEPQKSGGGLKIVLWILGIGGVLLGLGCGGCIVGSIFFVRSAVSNDPADVRETAQGITDLDPPNGYEPMFSANMFGVKVAGFGEEGQERILMLMSFPASMADEAEMRRQMDQSLQQQGGQNNLEEIESETRPYTICGEESQVRIAKARTPEGAEMRQITAIFKGKGGSAAMLLLMMSEEEWNNGGEQEFEKMLQSMK